MRGSDITLWASHMLNLLIIHKLRHTSLRTSSTRQKSKGDNGSRCLTPLLKGKKPNKPPFILIKSIAERRIVLIQLTNEGWKLKRIKTNNMNFQLKVSNAL